MIIVNAAHPKDKDETPKIKGAKPTNNIPKTQRIKTAPLLEVDGSRCLLSLSRASACVRVPPLHFPSLSGTHALQRLQV
jgi:hypothetical protein